MFNIDFTGGTLVTIRLNENDPEVKALTESRRAEFVRQKAEAGNLPDVTVESLRVGGDTTVSRFNIRTTDDDLNQVKTKILDAFKTSLDRVEMTSGTAKPIPPADPKAAIPDRFAGGREYPLTLNASTLGAQSPEQVVSAEFTKVLDAAKIANPSSRFEVVRAPGSKSAAEGSSKSTQLLLRTNLEPEIADAQIKTLATSLADNRDLLFERITNFGGTVAAETQVLAYIATIASWIIIIVYLWWRFRSLTYGLAAVLAVVHDVLITLGAIAVSYWLARIPGVSSFLQIEQFKIDLPIVSAFLTLIGFSVNDTIVIFDRIREIKGKSTQLTDKIVNDALNQTLSRTILTSLTAWLVVVILYLFGGEGLHGFAFALVVGFLSGTYSTIYIATPILVDWIGTDEAPEKAGSPTSGRVAASARS
jgi:SecD/SecF fusion protein